MLRTRAPRMYGVRTLLLGTLLPAPSVGESAAALLRAAEAAGHAVGLHGFDHVGWQDGVAAMDEAAVRASYARSLELVRADARARAALLGRAGLADHAREPARPGRARLRVRERLPRRRPVLSRARRRARAHAADPDHAADQRRAARVAAPRARAISPAGTTPTSLPDARTWSALHAEAEGIHFADWLRSWLDALRARAVAFVSLADVAERERERAATRRVVARELPGRVGAGRVPRARARDARGRVRVRRDRRREPRDAARARRRRGARRHARGCAGRADLVPLGARARAPRGRARDRARERERAASRSRSSRTRRPISCSRSTSATC